MIRGVVWNEALAILEDRTPAEAFATTLTAQKIRWSRPFATAQEGEE
jgi:hypothetical protein